MGDDETGSYWDHITGACVHGALKDKQLDVFPIEHTSAGLAARAYPGARLAVSRPPIWIRLLGRLMGRQVRKRGFLPPFFRRTMAQVDPRLPEMASGLGVWEGNVRRFYPVEELRRAGGLVVDHVGNRQVLIYRDKEDQTPHAVWWHTESAPAFPEPDARLERPMQLFTRWYGFSLTFPGCEIFAKT